jgi:hypothetical protein
MNTINRTRKTIVIIMALLMVGSVTAWNANPTYNPFEVLWNAGNDLLSRVNALTSRVDSLETDSQENDLEHEDLQKQIDNMNFSSSASFDNCYSIEDPFLLVRRSIMEHDMLCNPGDFLASCSYYSDRTGVIVTTAGLEPGMVNETIPMGCHFTWRNENYVEVQVYGYATCCPRGG